MRRISWRPDCVQVLLQNSFVIARKYRGFAVDYSSLCFPLVQKGVGDEGWDEGEANKTVLVMYHHVVGVCRFYIGLFSTRLTALLSHVIPKINE